MQWARHTDEIETDRQTDKGRERQTDTEKDRGSNRQTQIEGRGRERGCTHQPW